MKTFEEDVRRQRLEADIATIQMRRSVTEYRRQQGEENVMKTASECKRLFGKWFSDQVRSGKLVPVPQGNRLMYSVDHVLALQEVEYRDAAKRDNL